MFVRGETQAPSLDDAVAANPDEIDIDQDEDDEDNDQEVIQEQGVPRQVFGSLKKDNEDDDWFIEDDAFFQLLNKGVIPISLISRGNKTNAKSICLYVYIYFVTLALDFDSSTSTQ